MFRANSNSGKNNFLKNTDVRLKFGAGSFVCACVRKIHCTAATQGATSGAERFKIYQRFHILVLRLLSIQDFLTTVRCVRVHISLNRLEIVFLPHKKYSGDSAQLCETIPQQNIYIRRDRTILPFSFVDKS